MKKWTALLLTAVLCLSLCACGKSSGDVQTDYILSLIEEGNYDMAIYVLEGLRDQAGGAGDNGPTQTPSSGDELLSPEVIGTDLRFSMQLSNDGQRPITLVRLEIVDEQAGMPLGDEPYVIEGEMLQNIGLGDMTLQPGETRVWEDWHPADCPFDFREYRFIFEDDAGETVVQSFPYRVEAVDVPVSDPSASEEQRWEFHFRLVNEGDSTITLVRLEFIDQWEGQESGEPPVIFNEGQLANIGLGGVVLAPGESFMWADGHPVVEGFLSREYRFIFRDETGQETVQSFPYDLTTKAPAGSGAGEIDFSGESARNLLTLRHDVYFEEEVAPGVFWVPAVALGASDSANQQVLQKLSLSPEEKQQEINTLYEALQYYQIGGFYSSDDNIRIGENGINWEHHKPGYHAVRTNTGCCATDSNWLRYLLQDDYEEVGYMATSQRDGSGHIFNYILQDGWYYFVDLTHYRTDWIATAVESGNLDDYYGTDFIAGNIHKCRSVQDYVDYIQNTYSDPPGLMFLYTAENCLAVDGSRNANGTVIYYETDPAVDVQVVFDDPNDSLTCEFVAPPENRPDWNTCESYPF